MLFHSQKCLCDRGRNTSELADVVAKTAFYLRNVFEYAQNSTQIQLLEDYPGCGIRNNRTFGPKSLFDSYPDLNMVADSSDWSVECLWDCTWKDNPFVGKRYPLQSDYFNCPDCYFFLSRMQQVPVDLSCLSNCVDIYPPSFKDLGYNCFMAHLARCAPCGVVRNCSGAYPPDYDPVKCSGSASMLAFLTCYPYGIRSNYFVSQRYFDLAVEACFLASQDPSLYPDGDCYQQGVNLTVVFYQNFEIVILRALNHSYATLAPERLLSPASQPDTVSFDPLYGGTFFSDVNRNPWQCSLRTPGYRGFHRCGVTLLSGPPRTTIFVSAAHCNFLCKDPEGRLMENCCCRDSSSSSSCRGSQFCSKNSSLQLAQPQDLQIACNLRSGVSVIFPYMIIYIYTV